MAGTGIVFRYDGFKEILEHLNRLAAPQLQELAEFAGEKLLGISEEAFAGEQDPVSGEKWQQSLAAAAEGRQTLTDSAQLRRSLTYLAFQDGSVLAGSNKVYANIHNEGGQAGRGKKVKIPKRCYLGIPGNFGETILGESAPRQLLGLAA